MYSIKVLEERKDKLDYAYSDLVKNGDVNPNSKVALLNRKRSKDIEKALSILNDSKSDDIMSPIMQESDSERLLLAYHEWQNKDPRATSKMTVGEMIKGFLASNGA